MCVFGRVERRHAYTNNYYTTRMYRGGCKKAQVVRRALTKSTSRQMFVVYCITSSKLTRHVSNKPQNSFKSLWLAKGILFFIQYRTYRNASRFDVPFLILERRNFLFKIICISCSNLFNRALQKAASLIFKFTLG